MLYACLATFFCLLVGLTGLVLSFVDIERFNFGLYLALLSVVGSTVSIAFWIIAPVVCQNPKWVQRLVDRYGYKLDPMRKFTRRHFVKKRRRHSDGQPRKTRRQRKTTRGRDSTPSLTTGVDYTNYTTKCEESHSLLTSAEVRHMGDDDDPEGDSPTLLLRDPPSKESIQSIPRSLPRSQSEHCQILVQDPNFVLSSIQAYV